MMDWRDFSDDGLTPTLEAARTLFARSGYHATSIRAIADAAGLSVPGLYHHHESKQAILGALVDKTMERMLAHSRAALADADGTALGRFDNLMECMLRFHMQRRDDAFVASTEMRSMAEPVLKRHISRRDELQRLIAQVIAQGVDDGVFRCPHVGDAARAAASLCVSVADWYRPDGPLPPDQVVSRQLAIARRIAGAPAADQ